jgi:hypothetical protein
MHNITYAEGYAYRLKKDYSVTISIKGYHVVSEYVTLRPLGELFIKCGYAWDGLSGPTFQSRTGVRASLIHDALYQLLRDSGLERTCKTAADIEFKNACIADGMCRVKAFVLYYCVRAFGAYATTKNGGYQARTAPK